jgi:hypothetical protein
MIGLSSVICVHLYLSADEFLGHSLIDKSYKHRAKLVVAELIEK